MSPLGILSDAFKFVKMGIEQKAWLKMIFLQNGSTS